MQQSSAYVDKKSWSTFPWAQISVHTFTVYSGMCIIFSTCTGWFKDIFFEKSAFQDTSILSNWEEVSRIINKLKRLSVCVTSVLQVLPKTPKPPSVCVCSWLIGCVCVFIYLQRWQWAACIISKYFGSHVCLYMSTAPLKGFSSLLFLSVLGELAEALIGLWHWWCGRQCGRWVFVGSGCSSKPGKGWRCPRRPAAGRMSRTAREPGWAGSSPF